MAEGTRMLQRRAIKAVWDTSNYVLGAGEIGVETDTGVIKFGNGVDGWTTLSPALASQYLPILGKAADSAALDGISSSGFVRIGDPKTAATPDTIAKRTADGRLIAATAVAGAELTTLDQQTTAIDSAITTFSSTVTTAIANSSVATRLETIARTVTTSQTLLATDVNGLVRFNSASATTATIPNDATATISTGAWIDVQNINTGIVTIAFGAGVTLDRGNYPSLVLRKGDKLRFLKTGANSWLAFFGDMDSGYIAAPSPPAGLTVVNNINHYCMRNRMVHLVFNIQGNWVGNQTLYTLPVGFRPAINQYLSQVTGAAAPNPFLLNDTGTVVYAAGSANVTMLASMLFLAA